MVDMRGTSNILTLKSFPVIGKITLVSRYKIKKPNITNNPFHHSNMRWIYVFSIVFANYLLEFQQRKANNQKTIGTMYIKLFLRIESTRTRTFV